jgi:hypothetical protein
MIYDGHMYLNDFKTQYQSIRQKSNAIKPSQRKSTEIF